MKFLSTLSALLIALLPITVYYKSPFLFNQMTTLFFVIIIIVMLANLILRQVRRIESFYIKEYSLYILYLAVVSVISYTFSSYASADGFNNINMLISAVNASIVLILFNSRIVDYRNFIKVYKFIGYFAIIFLVVQILSFYLLRTPISGKIPFLDLLLVGYEGQYNMVRFASGRVVSFSSIFAEPSHVALYCIPLISFNLFSKEKKHLLIALVITALLFLTRSGNAIVITTVLWLYYFFTRENKISIKRIFVILMVLLGMYLIHTLLMNLPFYYTIINRLFVSDSYSVAKADYRVYRGFDYFFQTPFLFKIVGVGYKNMQPFMSHFNIISRFDYLSSANYEYMNAVAQILIYSGLIGFYLMIRFFVRLFKNSELMGRSIILVFILTCVSSSVLFDTFWVMYIAIIFSLIKLKQPHENIQRTEFT